METESCCLENEVRISIPALLCALLQSPCRKVLKVRDFGTNPRTDIYVAMGRSKNLILVFLAIIVTAVLLRRLLGAYALVVPLLYMFFDVNWSLRVTWIVLRKIISRASNPDFLEVFETNFIVLPSDMDLNLHMNNAR